MDEENTRGVGMNKYKDDKYYYMSSRNSISTIISKITDIKQCNTYLKERQSELDKQQQDLLHYIEFSNLDVSRAYKIYKQLKEVRVERRFVKNELESNEVAFKALSFMHEKLEMLKQVQGKCNRLENIHFERRYQIRSSELVLEDFNDQMERHNDIIKEMVVIK